jgi:hypothetical protein
LAPATDDRPQPRRLRRILLLEQKLRNAGTKLRDHGAGLRLHSLHFGPPFAAHLRDHQAEGIGQRGLGSSGRFVARHQ